MREKGEQEAHRKGGRDDEEILEIRGGVAWECEWEPRMGGERREEERRGRQERAGEQQWNTHPHRSVLQQQLQGDVSIIVVLGELGRPPHLLSIGDPHPSTLQRQRWTSTRFRGFWIVTSV